MAMKMLIAKTKTWCGQINFKNKKEWKNIAHCLSPGKINTNQDFKKEKKQQQELVWKELALHSVTCLFLVLPYRRFDDSL